MIIKQIGTIASALVLAIALAGCQTIGGSGLTISAAPADVSGPAASAIAGDMVSRLAEQVGPGKVTLVLKPDGSPFGQALEASLKGWGYAVVTDQKTEDVQDLVRLTYVIEPFDGRMLARLSTDRVEIGRAYTVTSVGAAPASPLSVMQRG